jgi:hypothetical protein
VVALHDPPDKSLGCSIVYAGVVVLGIEYVVIYVVSALFAFVGYQCALVVNLPLQVVFVVFGPSIRPYPNADNDIAFAVLVYLAICASIFPFLECGCAGCVRSLG